MSLSHVVVLGENIDLIPWGATLADVIVRCDGVSCDPERNVNMLSVNLDIPLSSDKFIGIHNYLSSTMYPPNISTKLEYSRHENFPCAYCWGNNSGLHKRLKYNYCSKIKTQLTNLRVVVDDLSFTEYSVRKRRGLIPSFGVSGYLTVDEILVHTNLTKNISGTAKICLIEDLPYGCVCGDLSLESLVVGDLTSELFLGYRIHVFNSDEGLVAIQPRDCNHKHTIYTEAIDRYLSRFGFKYGRYVRDTIMKDFYYNRQSSILGRSGGVEDIYNSLLLKFCVHDDP
jgi:hypothetical protein